MSREHTVDIVLGANVVQRLGLDESSIWQPIT